MQSDNKSNRGIREVRGRSWTTHLKVNNVHNGNGVTSRVGSRIKLATTCAGIDLTHADFPTPVETSDMPDGTSTVEWDTVVSNTVKDHGTHVSGTAVGSGSLPGGEYTGSAPGASFYFQKANNVTAKLDRKERLIARQIRLVRIKVMNVADWTDRSRREATFLAALMQCTTTACTTSAGKVLS